MLGAAGEPGQLALRALLEGLPMLNVRKDRPLVTGAPLGVQGEDAVGDYSRDLTALRAVMSMLQTGQPRAVSRAAVSVRADSMAGPWLALEPAVPAAARPAGRDHRRAGVQDDGQVGRVSALVELPDRLLIHAVHALQDQAGGQVAVADDDVPGGAAGGSRWPGGGDGRRRPGRRGPSPVVVRAGADQLAERRRRGLAVAWTASPRAASCWRTSRAGWTCRPRQGRRC